MLSNFCFSVISLRDRQKRTQRGAVGSPCWMELEVARWPWWPGWPWMLTPSPSTPQGWVFGVHGHPGASQICSVQFYPFHHTTPTVSFTRRVCRPALLLFLLTFTARLPPSPSPRRRAPRAPRGWDGGCPLRSSGGFWSQPRRVGAVALCRGTAGAAGSACELVLHRTT